MTETNKPEKTWGNFLNEWNWFFCALLGWWVIFDAICLKFFSFEYLKSPGLFLLLSGLPIVGSLFDKKFIEIPLYIGYLVFFPFFLIYEIVKLAYNLILFLSRASQYLKFPATFLGVCTLLITMVLAQIIGIFSSSANIHFVLAILHVCLIPLFLIPLSLFSMKPNYPMERAYNCLVRLIKWALGLYEKYFLSKVKKNDYKEVEWEIEQMEKVKKKITEISPTDLEKVDKVPRKVVVPFYLFAVSTFIVIFIFLFGGLFYSLNQVSKIVTDNTFVINQPGKPVLGLFDTLSNTARYRACVFQSFVVMFSLQDFTLKSTSRAGRYVLVLQVSAMTYIIIMLFTSFSIIIGLEPDYSMRVIDYRRRTIETIDEILNHWRAKLVPMVVNSSDDSKLNSDEKVSQENSKVNEQS